MLVQLATRLNYKSYLLVRYVAIGNYKKKYVYMKKDLTCIKHRMKRIDWEYK